jgi:thymidylate synthase ThyX
MFNAIERTEIFSSDGLSVGNIEAWNPWDARKSERHAKWWVSKIARLSHGLGEAENFEAHYDRVVNQLHHVSVLEFVPVVYGVADAAIPYNSLRLDPHRIKIGIDIFDDADCEAASPATAFLVECPLIVRAQWMRHRSQAFLEMSRRYVKGSKIPFTFYCAEDDALLSALYEQAVAVYNYLIDCKGWKPERARIAIPQGAMTKFWCAGFDSDWKKFVDLRNDPHAQDEIRVFASWIDGFLHKKVGGS